MQKFKAGDLVCRRDSDAACFSWWTVGKAYEVYVDNGESYVTADDGDTYCLSDTGWDEGDFYPAPNPKPEVGDYVRITQEGGQYSHNVRLGAIVEVCVAYEGGMLDVRVLRDDLTDRGRVLYRHRDDITQTIHKDDYETAWTIAAERRFKVGDKAFRRRRYGCTSEDELEPIVTEAPAEVSEEADEGMDAEDLLEMVVEELQALAGFVGDKSFQWSPACDTVDRLVALLGYRIAGNRLVEVEWTD